MAIYPHFSLYFFFSFQQLTATRGQGKGVWKNKHQNRPPYADQKPHTYKGPWQHKPFPYSPYSIYKV